MIKFLEVIPRRRDLTHAYFLEHLSTKHLEVVDLVPEFRNRVRRYVQTHLYVEPAELSCIQGTTFRPDADALIEVWFDTIGEVFAAFQEPRYFSIIRPDEHAFGDVAGAWGLPIHETIITERPGFAGLIRLFIFLRRSDALSHASFQERWREFRDRRLLTTGAFRACIGRFVENWVSQDPAEAIPGMKPYDLIAQFGLNTLSDVGTFTADPAVRQLIAATAQDLFAPGPGVYLGRGNPAATEWLEKVK